MPWSRTAVMTLGIALGCEGNPRVRQPEPPLAAPSPTPVASTHPPRLDGPRDSGPEAGTHLLRIHLVPIGAVAARRIEQTARSLEAHVAVSVQVHPRYPFPHSAKSTRANAYKAESLLDWLDSLPLPSEGKRMGLTDADIVTRKGSIPIWGILGMGSIDGRCSVLSTYRMERKWEGGAPEALVEARLWKIAVHELGHTLGLDHCPKVGCIMEDGHGTVKTIDRDETLCPSCQHDFDEKLSRLAAADSVP